MKRYCSGCDKLRPTTSFWSPELLRYVSHCLWCRSESPRTEPAGWREPPNIVMPKVPGLAACVKFVVDQLPKRY